MGIVSLTFIAGMSVSPVEAGFGAFSKYTQNNCSRDPVLALQSLNASPQPNCIKGALNSLNNIVSGRAPKNFIHIMKVAEVTDSGVIVAFDHLLQLVQKNIKEKVPFSRWNETSFETAEGGFDYELLKDRVARALNPQAVKLASEDGNIESKQLLIDGSKISAKDCANDLNLALQSALSTNPNKSGMKAALFQAGTKGSNASFLFVFALFSPEDQEKIKQLFAVRAGMENISGAELKALLMEIHQIVHNHRDVLSLYNLGGTYNRLTCAQNFYTALKSVLFPGNNKNCWLAIEKALNSPSTLKESLSSLDQHQEQAFRKVLAARKGGIPAKIDDVKTLLNLWVQVKESKTMPSAAVPFKTIGMAKAAGAYFALNKAACANSLEKFFFALLLEKTHKNCLAGALTSTADVDISFKEHSRFHKGYRSSEKGLSMVPGWNDLNDDGRAAFIHLAKVRLGQLSVKTPQEKQMLVLKVMQAYMEAKAISTKRYLESIPKPAQAAAVKSAGHDMETMLLKTVMEMGEQSKRIAGDPKAHASFLADLEVLISALKALQSRSNDGEHKQVFEGVIKQLQLYVEKLKRESTTEAQAMEIQSAVTQAVASGIVASTSAENGRETSASSSDNNDDNDNNDNNDGGVDMELFTAGAQKRMGVDMHGNPMTSAGSPAITGPQSRPAITGDSTAGNTLTSSMPAAGPLAIMAPPSQLALTTGVNDGALVSARAALKPVSEDMRSPAYKASIGKNV